MSPNDIVVHCESAQSVALSALGGLAWWTGFSSFFLTMIVSGLIFAARNEKERKEMQQTFQLDMRSNDDSRRKYENARSDHAKKQREYEEKIKAIADARTG